jgi:hypothetical protein
LDLCRCDVLENEPRSNLFQFGPKKIDLFDLLDGEGWL